MTSTTDKRTVISMFALVLFMAASIFSLLFIGLRISPAAAVVFGAVGLAVGLTYGISVSSNDVYPSTLRGWFILLVDVTWSLPNTVLGSLYLAILLLLGKRPERQQPPESHRVTLVLKGRPREGYAGMTIGPVQLREDASSSEHEYVHVFQARLLGPAYFPLVFAHYALATVLPYWLLYHDRAKLPITSFGDYFNNGVYEHVWNEKWAYAVAP
jgi:ABC-type dipeptide/oligopeptide/nickel transport system permease subunit